MSQTDDLLKEMVNDLGIGKYTLLDIVNALEKPRFDPREELPKPTLRNKPLGLEDLKPGMIIEGIIRNVVDFGAFVDIGLKHDGLIHISEMSDNFVTNPYEILSVGDQVMVRILSVDFNRKRIALSLKDLEK